MTPKNHKVKRAREAKQRVAPPPPPPPTKGTGTLTLPPLEARAKKDAALAELYRELARCARKIQEVLDIVIEQEEA
jgi:hypothetical protein